MDRRTAIGNCQGSETMTKNEKAVSEPAWNLPELLVRVDNDRELLCELLAIFKEDFPKTMSALETAVICRDLKNTASLSHTLKGMFSNLAGARASAAAAKLEQLASAGENDSLQAALKTLQQEAASLLPEVDAYMAGVQS
jgi:two-component system, sensor histidine kinase and response regulator